MSYDIKIYEGKLEGLKYSLVERETIRGLTFAQASMTQSVLLRHGVICKVEVPNDKETEEK